ncbi:MAG: ABC transporter permease [Wolinella sp.]
MKNLMLIAWLDLRESFRSRWFLVYSIVFGGAVALFFLAGVTESRVLGFSGLSRLLLLFIQVCVVILPVFILMSTVRAIAQDRDSNVLEYLLSFPVSLRDYYFGKSLGRLITVFVPVFGALVLALAWGAIKGAQIPWAIFVFYILLMFALSFSFVGIALFISSLVKSQEIALGSAFFIWLCLLAFIDILLIGAMMRNAFPEEVIFAIALLNPIQVFRVAAMAIFDPEMSVMGSAAYFILDGFGKVGFSIYSVIYPIFLGIAWLLGGYFIFKTRDLV